jgi:uncharacterized protein YfaS (alpha-2-macroglobulin family)
MNSAKLKTLVIVALALIVAAQTLWIVRSPSLPGDGRPGVKELRVGPGRTAIEVELTGPADTTASTSGIAALDPEADGEWVWSNPYLLTFRAKSPLKEDTAYTVTLGKALQLAGERTFTVHTATFSLDAMDLSERAGAAPGSAEVAATLRFSAAVSPEDLLTHVRLEDAADGSAVALRATTSWSSSYVELRSAPVTKTVEGRTYRLTVERGLKMAGGDLALPRDAAVTIDIRLDPVLAYRGADAESSPTGSSIRLTFSTPMDARTAAPFITVQPETDYALSADGSVLVLSGGFMPGVRYGVTLRDGLTAADGALLATAKSATLTMPDITPAVDFVGTGLFLPRGTKAGLAIEAVNTDRVDLRVDRVYPNNLFAMLSEYGSRLFEDQWDYNGVPSTLGGTVFEATLRTEGPRNQSVRVPVHLDAIRAGQRGLFKISAAIPGQSGVKRWLALTDIGLTAKRGTSGFLVWAVSSQSLKPLAGTRLTLISDKNQPLARAVTDARGAATLPLPASDDAGSPFMILAEQGDDFAFLLLSRAVVDTTGLDVSGVAAPEGGLRAFVYGERDLYRPGETLKGLAVVRRDDITAPAAMPLTLVERDARGREVRALRLTTGDNGVVPFALDLPDYALTGAYSLELKAGDTVIGGFPFKVEEFVPDRIKVEVTTDGDTFAPGQNVRAEVAASYLFGPPASALPVTVRTVLRPAPFSAKGYETYVFGDPDAAFAQQDIFSEDATLSETGTASFTIPVPDGLAPPAALEAVIYGRVSEAGGRGVTARKRVVVHPYPYYLGLRGLDRSGFAPGTAMDFDFVAVDGRGAPCAHGPLAARLYRDRWRTVVRLAPSGGYLYESVNDPELLSQKPVAAGTGAGSVSFTPPGFGSYSVVLTADAAQPGPAGSSARTSFFCGGWGYSPWALENPARIELVPDKPQYAPGDTATIQIRAPFPGRVLLAVEGENVNATQVVELTGNTGEVSFPVERAYAPNVHVTALLMRKAADVAEGSVGRAFGAVPLPVDTLANRLTPEVSAPAEVRPEAELALTVSLGTTARPGSVVTIAAVDEGIMQLSGTDDPDPFGFFYARRALRVTSYDTFAMLYPDLTRIMGAARPGGGMEMLAESQFMRTEGIRRVTPVAFWSGPLTVGDNGLVHWRVTLPDFQGALRVVAVALDGKRLGTGRTMVRVRSPLAVTPTLPRFMAAGDAIDMPVTVRNDTGAAAAITVKATASGALTVAAQPAAQPAVLTLAHGAEQTIYLPLTAKPGAGGDATVQVSATATPHSPAPAGDNATGHPSGPETRRVTVTLPVRPAAPFRRTLAFGSVNGAGGRLVPAAEGFVPGTVTRDVVLGGLPLTRFSGKLENLLRYPYGCAEQTASQAFPLIRFGDLARAFDPAMLGDTSPAFMVQSAIMRLGAMQTGNGGFALWPGGEDDTPWVSAYVTHFLLEAARAGYTSPGLLDRATGRMADLGQARDKDLDPTAYALFNLALAGRPDRGSMDELRDRRAAKLTALGRTLLACAYGLTNDRDSFNRLLADRPAAGQGRAPGGGMGSGLRDAALMLLALAEAAPGDPLVPELAADVARRMATPDWGTTQENGLAFAAMGKVLAATPTAPLSGRLTAGDWEAPFTGATTVTTATDRADALGVELAPATAEQGEPTPRSEADNATVYWSVTTRGVPVPESLTPVSQGLEIRRTFLDRSGAAANLAALPQGALVFMKTEVRAGAGPVDNVVIQCLLPAGLEVENPRLATTETASLAADGERPLTGHQDLRDDRVLFFTDLADANWHAGYTQLRAVTPGTFGLPPVQAEAMYDPAVMAADAPGQVVVIRRN